MEPLPQQSTCASRKPTVRHCHALGANFAVKTCTHPLPNASNAASKRCLDTEVKPLCIPWRRMPTVQMQKRAKDNNSCAQTKMGQRGLKPARSKPHFVVVAVHDAGSVCITRHRHTQQTPFLPMRSGKWEKCSKTHMGTTRMTWAGQASPADCLAH